jgi:hypothetical protein
VQRKASAYDTRAARATGQADTTTLTTTTRAALKVNSPVRGARTSRVERGSGGGSRANP